MAGHEHHEKHHASIDHKVAAVNAYPQRSRDGRVTVARREAIKHAAWAISVHLRCCHGWSHPVGPAVQLPELQHIHEDMHRRLDTY